MNDLNPFSLAFDLLLSGDPELWEIIALSLRVSLTAALISCALAFPAGALLATQRFWGRSALVTVIMALMGLPPVVVGLLVYLALSASGPLAVLELLFTPTAMIIAQVILITPIVTALTLQALEDLHHEYDDYLTSLRLGPIARIRTLLWDARIALSVAALAGLGRAFAEVGAVMIVGGNINHHTRVMTTAITLETSRGELALAVALGLILLLIGLSLNVGILVARHLSARSLYA